MNWRVGGPAAIAAAMVAAAWAGIATQGQDERLSAALFWGSGWMLGILTTMLIVQWWKDGG